MEYSDDINNMYHGQSVPALVMTHYIMYIKYTSIFLLMYKLVGSNIHSETNQIISCNLLC